MGFSLNYLANVPEVIDLAVETKRRRPATFVFAGGHSASFIAGEILEHARGAMDCVVRGEGEAITPLLLAACRDGSLETLPGVVTREGAGPNPTLLDSLDQHMPARDLTRRRRKYFIGVLDPCASVEFTRGCPWDCSFCSAWTFYGRSYRKSSPEAAAEDVARIREPNVFLVDDVAFIHWEDGYAIGRELERRGVKKEYYLETRCDVLVKNREVFAYWKRLGLHYMFLGIESIDEEGLKLHRKRVVPGRELQGPGGGPRAGPHGGPQHHRRSRLGRGALRHHPGVGPEHPGDRAPHGEHALPGHGDVAHRVAHARPRWTTGSSTSSTPSCPPACPSSASTRSW